MASATASKLDEVLEALHGDMTACECLVALVSGAALSYRYDSSLRPFPPMFMRDGEKDIEALRMAFSRLPKLSTISKSSSLEPDALSLLHWCVCCQPFRLRSGEKTQSAAVGADYLVELEPSPQQRRLFDEAKRGSDPPVHMAFHGTKLESVFSIMHCGLLAHMNKLGVFGSGTYLTTERPVALNFTNSAAIWERSSLGTHLRCIAVCEYVADHPDVRSTNNTASNRCLPKKHSELPEKYILVKNNSAVRIKSLILYSTKTPKRAFTARNLARCWSHLKSNKFLLIALIYIVASLLVKLSSSKPARRLWSLLHTNPAYH